MRIEFTLKAQAIALVCCQRRAINVHANGRGVGGASTIFDGVFKGRIAEKAWGRGKDHIAINQRHGAVHRVLHRDNGQGVAQINISIVTQQLRRFQYQRLAFVGFKDAIVIRHWIIVHWRDFDIQRASSAGVGGVAHLRHVAVPVRYRREGIVTVASDVDGADAVDGRSSACRVNGRIACHHKAGYRQNIVHINIVR